MRTWRGYNTLVTPGDVTGDGRADFLARTPAGTLFLYPGTGKATSEIFGTRVRSAPATSSTTSSAETRR